jgi:NAD(P)-dependent dehydrogenase (short-subunit alcohol dehydrogenase family)
MEIAGELALVAGASSGAGGAAHGAVRGLADALRADLRGTGVGVARVAPS